MSNLIDTNENNIDIGFVNGMQFGIYSPEVIRAKSVVHITCETLYDTVIPIPFSVSYVSLISK